MTIWEVLSTIEVNGEAIPAAYSHFRDPVEPPYIVYIGSGQDTLDADNTHYWRRNNYQVEFYFTEKNEALEAAIEDALLAAGFLYEKSEDVYIEEMGTFVIYYAV